MHKIKFAFKYYIYNNWIVYYVIYIAYKKCENQNIRKREEHLLYIILQ